LELAFREERSDAPSIGRAQSLVEVVQGGAGRERDHHRVDAQGEPEVPRDLTCLEDKRRLPCVRAAAQVLDDEVQLVAVLVESNDIVVVDACDEFGPGVELAHVVVGTGANKFDQLLWTAEQIDSTVTSEKDWNFLFALRLILFLETVLLR